MRRHAVRALQFSAACALFALAYHGFYSPARISAAGLTGLAQILHTLLPELPVGATALALNVPLLLVSRRILGARLVRASILAMAGTSFALDALGALYVFPPLDPALAAVFGGGLMGLSLGLIFRMGATTGGTDLIARLVQVKAPWLSMGRLVLAADLAVIALAAAVFRSAQSAMYAVAALYVSSLVMDEVLYGPERAKVAYIISRAPDAVTETLTVRLGRGVTALRGTGAYTGSEVQVLMCAFRPKEIVRIKRAVIAVDPEAFIIVCPAHEVLGRGFGRGREDAL